MPFLQISDEALVKFSSFISNQKIARHWLESTLKVVCHHSAIGCLANLKTKTLGAIFETVLLWNVTVTRRDSHGLQWTSKCSLFHAQTQHWFASSKQQNVNQCRRHFASLPDRFHSLSRQSSFVVAYECRSFVHFGKLSPQKISWDILFSLILP